MTTNLKRKLAIGFGLGIIVFIGLLLYGDVREIGHLLNDFRWNLLPAIFGLTVINYLLRGLRFHYYLAQTGIRNINFWTSLRVFIGGFSLTLTPGKFGEFVRLLWLKNLADADPARAAPTIIVDRIIDGLALALLASLGALAYPQYWSLIVLILIVLIAGIIVIQVRPLALWFLNIGEKLPLVSKLIHHLHVLYESAYELLRLKNFLIGLAVGLVAWTIEGFAFYLILIGLGLPNVFDLALLAIFTLAVGSILGGVSSLPGGLGATEISMTGILQAVVHLSENVAATATLFIRFFTLWFGVLFGILIVIIWRNLLFHNDKDEPGLGLDNNPELTTSDYPKMSKISASPLESKAAAPTSSSVRRKWDQRYAGFDPHDHRRPTPFVMMCLSQLSVKGRALDIAAGAGRHSLALARHGLRVDAIDISWQGLQLARQRASEAQFIPGKIRFIVADIERTWPLNGQYDVILVSFFLHRPLFPVIRNCLLPGGWLIYETYTIEQLAQSDHHRPSRLDFYLKSGELQNAFSDFEILVYDEGNHNGRATAQLLAQKPASLQESA